MYGNSPHPPTLSPPRQVVEGVTFFLLAFFSFFAVGGADDSDDDDEEATTSSAEPEMTPEMPSGKCFNVNGGVLALPFCKHSSGQSIHHGTGVVDAVQPVADGNGSGQLRCEVIQVNLRLGEVHDVEGEGPPGDEVARQVRRGGHDQDPLRTAGRLLQDNKARSCTSFQYKTKNSPLPKSREIVTPFSG